MRPSVYVETSVISYLVGRLNERNLLAAAHQELTREWWETRRRNFELFTSAVVVEEAARGGASIASARIEVVSSLRFADVTADARELAARLLRDSGLPGKANADALHIAVAAVNGLDYLLTWNCTHLANAVMIPRVNMVCRASGFEPPYICTPEELMVG